METLSLLVFCYFVTITTSATVPLKFHEEWMLWKDIHGKEYSSKKEELQKHKVWLQNKNYIDEHNAMSDVHGFTLKINHLGDLTDDEYCSQYSCYQMRRTSRNYTIKAAHPTPDPDILQLPEVVDWRTKNAVTHVKDQGQCGACYAFSAAGALEGAHALAHDELVMLSEQNILDCSVPFGNHGCNGGNMYDVFQYVIDNNGLDTEDSYPYQGKQGQCKFNHNTVGASETGIIEIPPREADLQAAVATGGPIAVAIDGSSNAFRFYEKGVFDEPNCSSAKLTHAVLLIGYGNSNGKPYWLVKNSWGPNWGMHGYIMMAKDKSNQCGIATDASFPTL